MFNRNRGGQPVVPPEAQPVAEEIPASIIQFKPYDNGELYDVLAAEDGECSLINARLPLPASDVHLKAESRGGLFALYGTVQLPDDNHAKSVLKKVTKTVKRQAPEQQTVIEEYRDAVQITTPKGINVLIGRSSYYSESDCILVSTGSIHTGYDSYTEVFENPELTPEIFQDTLTQTLGAIALVLNTAYTPTRGSNPREISLRVADQRRLSCGLSRRESESKQIVPDINQQPNGEALNVSLDDIGGQPQAKEEIRSLAYALSHPETYERWGTRPPKGVLFEGPPGTGKTLLAKALASETDAAFFSVSVSDIMSKWLGDSEKRIKKVFEQAAKAERAVIYFDEIDALTPSRNGSSHEATKRVVSVILQHMDGMNAKDNVLVVASTNRSEDMDKAILRPGRFDRKIFVGLPDTEGREAIFNIHMQKARTLAKRDVFTADIDAEKLAVETDGMSGADVSEIIRRALELKVRQESLTKQPANPVSADDILVQIEQYKANV